MKVLLCKWSFLTARVNLLGGERPTVLWQWTAPVTAGRFEGHRWHTELPKLFVIFVVQSAHKLRMWRRAKPLTNWRRGLENHLLG